MEQVFPWGRVEYYSGDLLLSFDSPAGSIWPRDQSARRMMFGPV
jgi:hypothetical protein